MSWIIEPKREPEWDVDELKKLFDEIVDIRPMQLDTLDQGLIRLNDTDVIATTYEPYRTRRLKCEYCGCISGKDYGTCEHCGAPLVEEN